MAKAEATKVPVKSRRALHYVSLAVFILSFAIGAWFAFRRVHPRPFALTTEYQLVPEDFVLPAGMDIRHDLQSGLTWAKIPGTSGRESVGSGRKEERGAGREPSTALEFVEDVESDGSSSPDSGSEPAGKHGSQRQLRNGPPAYSNNSQKWQAGFSELSQEVHEALEALESDGEREEALEYLKDKCSAFEVGAGIMHSPLVSNLFELLSVPKNDHDILMSALAVISSSMQNNYVAMKRASELELLQKHVFPLMQETAEIAVIRRCLIICNSFLINGDHGRPETRHLEQLKPVPELLLQYFVRNGGALPRAGGINDRFAQLVVDLCLAVQAEDKLQLIVDEFRKNRGLELTFCPLYPHYCREDN